jgi:hypothetical protein
VFLLRFSEAKNGQCENHSVVFHATSFPGILQKILSVSIVFNKPGTKYCGYVIRLRPKKREPFTDVIYPIKESNPEKY